jgi:hypothetical protein
MSNQTHLQPIEDAAKKRRKYLRERTQANMVAAVALGIAIVFALPLLFVFGTFFLSLLTSGRIPDVVSIVYGFLILGLFGGPACLAWIIRQHFTRKAASLLYVPPVSEQIAALPADEILLRGSDMPAAAQGELLRPVREGTETEAGELLRPTEGL